MATDKPRITAYVRQDLFDKFDKFCLEYEVKHSKGIELILAEYFTGDIPDVTLDPLSNMGLSESRVKTLIREQLQGDSPWEYTSDLPKDLITKDNLSESLSELPKDTLTQILSDAFSSLLGMTPKEIADLKVKLEAQKTRLKSTAPVANEAAIASSESSDNSTTERLPSENKPEATQEPSQDIKSVEVVNKTNIEGKPINSTEEAHALAVSRGYKGAKPKSFADGINREGNAQKYQVKYGIVKIDKGKYIDIGV